MTVVRLVLAALILAAGAAYAQDSKPVVAEGQKLFMVQGCYGCHIVGRVGTPIGPELSHVGSKYPESYLRRWLHDPQAQRPSAHMPKIELGPGEAEALAAYLASLQ